MIEPLEPRIAPASLTFKDADGDRVTITTTGPGTLTLGVNVIVTSGQLQKLDLTGVAFQSANVSIVATRDPVLGGDGRVNVGLIDATDRDLGAVLVDGDLGQLLAGSGIDTKKGVVSLTAASLGRLGTTTGASKAELTVDGRLGLLAVAGDVVKMDIEAGNFGTIRIGGSLIGGANPDEGLIFTRFDIGSVSVGGDLVGAESTASGTIEARGSIGPVTIGGSLRGGAGSPTLSSNPEFNSGALVARGSIGPVKIGGDILGGSGNRAGAISAGGGIAALTIGGSLFGGSQQYAGSIVSGGAIGPVKIGGSIVGSDAFYAGGLFAATLGAVTVGGSLLGGSQPNTGFIESMGAMGAVKIGGDIGGGEAVDNSIAANSGYVFARNSLTSITLGGSLRGTGFDSTGVIASFGTIGAVRIGGDVVGGSYGKMNSTITKTGGIVGQRIGSVFIGGSLIAGFATNGATLRESGAIRADFDLGAIVIKGSIVGNGTEPVFITAEKTAPGTAGFVAIRSLTVGGRVERAQIVAGVNAAMAAMNGDAQIGAISVGGDWIASRVAAGTNDGLDDIYGTDGDSFLGGGSATVMSKIASITIKGQVFGSLDPAESFRFMAEKIGSFRAGGTPFPLTVAADNLRLGTTPGLVRIFDAF